MFHPEQHWARLKLVLRFNSDKPMFRPPLIIRILPIGSLEEEPIVCGGVLEVAQMIVGRRPQEISYGILWQQLHPGIQRPNHERVILILAGGEREAAIRLSKVGLEFHRSTELLLSFRELLLRQQSFAQAAMQFS